MVDTRANQALWRGGRGRGAVDLDIQRLGFVFCPWRQTASLVKEGMLCKGADDHRSDMWDP